MEPEPPPSMYGPAPAPPPATYAPAGAAPPAGAGARTAAAIVLLLIGLVSVAYNGWDLALLAEDQEVFELAGLGWVRSALLVIDGALIVSALLQVSGGVALLANRAVGRAFGLVGSAGTLLAWVAFLGVVVGGDLLAGVSVTAWVLLLVSTSGSVLAGGLLLAVSGRSGGEAQSA